ncbi:MAG: cell division protein FtsQ [Syntrophorhabdus sp. PtaU1.Bin002]|nr:MAG: cell division protein FtsQ [Syntrophorhabdus sp. PtaB.Bin006]OPY69438.1 MAG: cell division protein FtsQ [Syntrophorhabdus sp. PtaU1.Bin002]
MKKTLYMLFLIPLCVLSMLTVIYIFAKDEPLFFLKNIKVNGVQQLREPDIMGRIAPFLSTSLFKVDIAKMREAIVSHPFVKEVRIKRVYPFSLVIDVKERKPSALWVDGEGQVHVLDESGEPYRGLTKGDVKGLFVINAREKSEAKSLYKQVNEWFQEGLIKQDVLSDIAYNEGSITMYGAEDGVEIILGKEDQKGRLKRAVAVLEDAKKRGFLIKCIDARFERGAIIKERQG